MDNKQDKETSSLQVEKSVEKKAATYTVASESGNVTDPCTSAIISTVDVNPKGTEVPDSAWLKAMLSEGVLVEV